MGRSPTPAGQSRAQKFHAVGEYPIRDEELPHVQGAIVVVATPYLAQVDDKGAFKIEAPEGHYTLRVYHHGAWVVSRALEVQAHNNDVSVHVPARPDGAAR